MLQPDPEELPKLFDAVQPGLFDRILSRQVLQEEHYATLIREEDGLEYSLPLGGWKESTTAHFHFVLITRLPVPPEWYIERMFILKVA